MALQLAVHVLMDLSIEIPLPVLPVLQVTTVFQDLLLLSCVLLALCQRVELVSALFVLMDLST